MYTGYNYDWIWITKTNIVLMVVHWEPRKSMPQGKILDGITRHFMYQRMLKTKTVSIHVDWAHCVHYDYVYVVGPMPSILAT